MVVVILFIFSVDVFEVKMVFGLYILFSVENMVFFIFIFLKMVLMMRLILVKLLYDVVFESSVMWFFICFWVNLFFFVEFL